MGRSDGGRGSLSNGCGSFLGLDTIKDAAVGNRRGDCYGIDPIFPKLMKSLGESIDDIFDDLAVMYRIKEEDDR